MTKENKLIDMTEFNEQHGDKRSMAEQAFDEIQANTLSRMGAVQSPNNQYRYLFQDNSVLVLYKSVVGETEIPPAPDTTGWTDAQQFIAQHGKYYIGTVNDFKADDLSWRYGDGCWEYLCAEAETVFIDHEDGVRYEFGDGSAIIEIDGEWAFGINTNKLSKYVDYLGTRGWTEKDVADLFGVEDLSDQELLLDRVRLHVIGYDSAFVDCVEWWYSEDE